MPYQSASRRRRVKCAGETIGVAATRSPARSSAKLPTSCPSTLLAVERALCAARAISTSAHRADDKWKNNRPFAPFAPIRELNGTLLMRAEYRALYTNACAAQECEERKGEERNVPFMIYEVGETNRRGVPDSRRTGHRSNFLNSRCTRVSARGRRCPLKHRAYFRRCRRIWHTFRGTWSTQKYRRRTFRPLAFRTLMIYS